jgi:hypothetical protein
MPQKAQRGSKGISLLILNLGASLGWVVNATPRPLYSCEGASVPILQKAEWIPEAGLDGCGEEKICLHASGFEPSRP